MVGRDLKLVAVLSVSASGTVHHVALEDPNKADRCIQKLPDGKIVGKSQHSTQIIAKFDLNSEDEIQYRYLVEQIIKSQLPFNDSEIDFLVSVFLRSLSDIAELARNAAFVSRQGRPADLMYRMLYANVITALETFLSDFLVYMVSNDKGVLASLLTNHTSLNTHKVSLSEVLFNSDLPKQTAINNIKSSLLHNVKTASTLYENAFGIVYPTVSNLKEAIQIRHDIVHRNGVKLNYGEKDEAFHAIDKKKVFEVVLVVQAFIEKLLSTIATKQGRC